MNIFTYFSGAGKLSDRLNTSLKMKFKFSSFEFYDACEAYSLLNALPMTIRLTSEVPAPISYNFAL
jgi:hypothetical protein